MICMCIMSSKTVFQDSRVRNGLTVCSNCSRVDVDVGIVNGRYVVRGYLGHGTRQGIASDRVSVIDFLLPFVTTCT